MLKMPDVRQTFFELNGGLDLQTPAIVIPPGVCSDAQNYEQAQGGGYARIRGYERYDGQALPSSKSYWLLSITLSGAIAVGNTVTGATSAATGVVLYVNAANTLLVLARVSGTFVIGENLTVGGAVQAVTTSAATENSAASPSDDADYAYLAAEDWRTLIAVVPGSGIGRGVMIYNDVVYAFRDNAGGTAGNLYKATSSGWTQIVFKSEISFGSGAGVITAGQTLTGATSGASATVFAVLLRTGTWGGTGVGTIVLTVNSGTFQSAENLQVGGVTKAVSTSVVTAITRAAGGVVETSEGNFTGSTATNKIYGADGVNLAFEFDGTTYVPIRTGMTTDTPTHVVVHKMYLILSFLGSIQLSGLMTPYAWTTVLGASEIATGDYVTGFVPTGGDTSGSALGIFTQGRTFILYGTTTSDFRLVASTDDLGYSAYTMQPVSNNVFGLTARGIQALATTLNYGDYAFASISHLIQDYMTTKLGLEVSSTISKSRNQYRVYFNDGYGLSVGMTGGKVSGMFPINYGKPVRVVTTKTLATGEEVTYWMGDDGYVYRDNSGTSFDGDEIEAWVRLPFNHIKSPRVRKRYLRAVLEAKTEGYAKVSASYDLGYGDSGSAQPAILADQVLIGAGGYWDTSYWDSFVWDAPIISAPSITIDGTEKNISFMFYSNRYQDKSHTLQGITVIYIPRRVER